MTPEPDHCRLFTLDKQETWLRASHLGPVLTPDEFTALVLEEMGDDTPADGLTPSALPLFAKWQEGDEVRSFSTSAASFASLAGRAGYVRLRGRKIVHLMVTRMS